MNPIIGCSEDSSPTSRSIKSTVCNVSEVVTDLLDVARLLPVMTLFVVVEEVDLLDVVCFAFCSAKDGIAKCTFGTGAEASAMLVKSCTLCCFEEALVAVGVILHFMVLPASFIKAMFAAGVMIFF